MADDVEVGKTPAAKLGLRRKNRHLEAEIARLNGEAGRLRAELATSHRKLLHMRELAEDYKLLVEENRKTVRQLQESNRRLQSLDETKDDFVSLASHQLRTPLTSVKGYISLVLEGDAGKITPQQHKLLTQAFASSQRMVILIADLLNVSRLKTGKFEIEEAPVEPRGSDRPRGGPAQGRGRRTVAQAGLPKKPKSFPVLMMETKMNASYIVNFVDKAFITPSPGGTITISLIDKPQTVELRVEDEGIGVPKSEQKHLFTKFYRASNARKTRPDGTGLGLFMAKKVIIAQGGALIFDSKEGRGSTFGFTFSKAKLAPPAK